MKKILFPPILLLLAMATDAQQTAPHYYSVFYGTERQQSAARTATAARPQPDAGLNALPGWMGHREWATGMYRDLYGPALTVPGATPEARVQYCMEKILPALGIDKDSWQAKGFREAPHATFARFNQYYAGHKVAFARLTLRFTPDGRLQRILHYAWGAPDQSLTPSLPKESAFAAALADLPGTKVEEQTAGEWEWFPTPSDGGYELRPAWPFAIAGYAADGMEMYLTGYVDARDGRLLYRDNEVKETFDMKVQGGVYAQSPNDPLTTEPLAHLRVTIGGGPGGMGGTNYYTDTAGILEIGTSNPSVNNASIALRGRWARVRTGSSRGTTPSFTANFATNGIVYTFPTTTPSSTRHVNTYYHVTRMHDYMKGFFSGFTGLDLELTANVDVNGSCNAYYNGGPNTLNFYREGNGCNSFALCGDIIYHEYGHAIAEKFYDDLTGDGMWNGALNEGQADVWAMGATNDPKIGEGAYVSGAGLIRRYDQSPKVYPQDIMGEVHADGQIIAGAWWDVAVNTGSVDTMMKLFTRTWYDTPDGPNGTEGAVYHDVLISALLNDDDDQDLSNGTPNFIAIVNAFARHGIYLLAGAEVEHAEIAHQPAGTAVPVTATLRLDSDLFPLFREMKLFYRVRGSNNWDSVMMNRVTPGNPDFAGQIPAQQKGSIIDYYFALYDYTGAANVFAPAGYHPKRSAQQSTIPYQFAIGVTPGHANDFETQADGWQIGNNPGDDATEGIWIRDVPVGSFLNGVTGQLPCQPANDHTRADGTGKCLVTGNAPATSSSLNAADVDNGITTVITPVFDLSGYADPVIEYYRWFSNDRGSNARTDPWQVQIRDSTVGAWVHSVEYTFQSDHQWRRRIFAVKEFLPNSRRVQLRFIAADRVNPGLPNNGQNTVEAAVDDFIIYDREGAASVDHTNMARAEVYPNPADHQLYIHLPGNQASGHAALYDLTGRLMDQVAIVPGVGDYVVSTEVLPAGQYLLKIEAGKTIQVRKIAVMH